MKTLFYLCLMGIVLAGCATSGTKIEQDQISKIKEGVTTEQEVTALLGSPFSKTLTSDGKTIMMYLYTKTQTKASTFIPVVGLFKGGMDMKQQTLSILIDQNGKVEKYTFNDADNEIKTGLLS